MSPLRCGSAFRSAPRCGTHPACSPAACCRGPGRGAGRGAGRQAGHGSGVRQAAGRQGGGDEVPAQACLPAGLPAQRSCTTETAVSGSSTQNSRPSAAEAAGSPLTWVAGGRGWRCRQPRRPPLPAASVPHLNWHLLHPLHPRRCSAPAAAAAAAPAAAAAAAPPPLPPPPATG
jgi:hypothetical protein